MAARDTQNVYLRIGSGTLPTGCSSLWFLILPVRFACAYFRWEESGEIEEMPENEKIDNGNETRKEPPKKGRSRCW